MVPLISVVAMMLVMMQYIQIYSCAVEQREYICIYRDIYTHTHNLLKTLLCILGANMQIYR